MGNAIAGKQGLPEFKKAILIKKFFILLDSLLFKGLSSFELLICYNQSRRANFIYVRLFTILFG